MRATTVTAGMLAMLFAVVSAQEQATEETETAAPAAAATDISVARHVVCRSVADREPVGTDSVFGMDLGTLCSFSEVNLEGEGEIAHKWYYGDRLIGSAITLKVKGPRWRTFSRKMIPQIMPGKWKVEVVNTANDEVLSTVTFKVTASKVKEERTPLPAE